MPSSYVMRESLCTAERQANTPFGVRGAAPVPRHQAPLVQTFRDRRYFLICTKVTPLTRLLARTKSPFFVTDVLRTMSPPPGMVQLSKFSVAGSKRTTVLGLVPDSLYQTTPLMTEMP